MKYSFGLGHDEWKRDFRYAYSIIYGSFHEFKEEEGSVANEKTDHFHYVSIVHNDTYGVGAKVSTTCSFDHYGAPLLTFANSVYTEEETGVLRYGDHYEVVAYEEGCNVWFVTKAPEGSGRRFDSECCLRLRFPIAEGSKIHLSTEIRENKVLRVLVNDASFDLPAPRMADEVYIGITACEGINHFYDAEITK